MRDPQKVLASWYKVGHYPTDVELGFTALEKIWNKVTGELKHHHLLVIDGTNFCQHPEKVLKHYCQLIDIEFEAEMLNWKHGRSEEWLPRKKQLSRYQNWHTTVDNAKSILPPTDIQVNIRKEDSAMLEKAISIYEKLISSSFAFIV